MIILTESETTNQNIVSIHNNTNLIQNTNSLIPAIENTVNVLSGVSLPRNRLPLFYSLDSSVLPNMWNSDLKSKEQLSFDPVHVSELNTLSNKSFLTNF